MRRILIESPYAGDVELNLRYARAAMRFCLLRGEAPYLSHALYTQPGVLDDDDPTERALGISAGLEWGLMADATVVFTNLGVSRGMAHGIAEAQRRARPAEWRQLPADIMAGVLGRRWPA